jgi:hypothetical protein
MPSKYIFNLVNKIIRVRVRAILFNATFNNISVISVEETRIPGENH